MRIAIALAAALALAGCGKKEKGGQDGGNGLPAAEDLSAFKPQAQELKARLLSGFVSQGFIVSMDGPTVIETGDAAIFTGESLLFLSCAEGQPVQDALIAAIHAAGGMIPRFAVPDPASDRPTSRDMVLGVMLGFLYRADACPDQRPAIEASWAEHHGYVKAMGGDLGPGTGNDLGSLHWLWDRASIALHATDNATDKGIFELGMTSTARSIHDLKSACYPMHLGDIQILAAAHMGDAVSDSAHQLFCGESDGMDLPLTDWLCGRRAASDWLAAFKQDEYQFRHQRCGGWEGPDGKGHQHPDVDFLLEYWLAGGTFDAG